MKKRLLTMLLFAAVLINLWSCTNHTDTKESKTTSKTTVDITEAEENENNKDGENANPVTLQISVSSQNKVSIPDPAKTGDNIQIMLQPFSEYKFNWNDWSSKRKQLYFADLSFAGFEKEMLVTSFAVDYIAEKNSSTAQIYYADKDNEKTKNGNCLILFVTDTTIKKMNKAFMWKQLENNYLLLLDYANGTYYKTKTEFWIDSNKFKCTDLTGDGKNELVTQAVHNTWVEFEVYRCDAQDHKMKRLYSSFETNGRVWFSGHLEDDYKAVLEFNDIGYSQTVSLLDAGYTTEDLDIALMKEKYILKDDEWYDKKDGSWHFDDTWPARLWKNAKLLKNKTDKVYLSLSTDYVSFETSSQGIPQLKLYYYVDIGHKSTSIGKLWLYLQYDKDQDKLILADAEFTTYDD